MRRALPSALVVCGLACGGASAAEPTVLALEVEHGASIVDTVWRDGDAVLVSEEVLAALNLRTPEGKAPYALTKIAGLQYVLDGENALVRITCTAQCFRTNQIAGRAGESRAVSEGAPISAFILNYDVVASAAENTHSLGGAFETSWVASRLAFESRAAVRLDEDEREAVRLDTALTVDMPARRARLRVGDTISRGGAWGLPTRFGGVKFGTDFSVAPNFVSHATPALRGESALPAAVDVYINDALRVRGSAPAGPFAIDDAPVTTGAGVARVVVTDVLGREQVVTTPFYVGPAMLKSGVLDYTIDAGAERGGFGVESADYGDGFAAVTLRRGFPGVTAEVRVEAADDGRAYGLSLASAAYRLGQIEVAAAHSEGARGEGGYGRVAWSRFGAVTNFSAAYEVADETFAPVGASDAVPPRGRAFASAGLSFGDAGLSLTATRLDARYGGDARTFAANFTYDFGRATAMLTALHAEDGEGGGGVALLLAVSAPFGDRGYASTSLESREGDVRASVYASRAAPQRGGVGWRARASSDDRFDAGVSLLHRAGLAEADVSHVGDQTGVRLHALGGAVFADKTVFVSREIDQSFAVVEAHPDMEIALNNTPVGRTDESGRLLVTGLGPYAEHTLSFDPTRTPFDLRFVTDTMRVTPQGRGGVVARFGIDAAGGRWVRVCDWSGAPIASGIVFRRDKDGETFFVGADGKAFVSAPAGGAFEAKVGGRLCAIDVSDAEEVRCAA